MEISQAGVEVSEPQVAVDAAGNITAVWVNGTSTTSIYSAYRPAGGAWEAPAPRIVTASSCSDPQLAVSSTGAAVVVADCGTGTTKMQAAYRPAGGAWAASSDPLPGSESGKEPRVAIDDSGNAVAVWAKEDSTVQSSYRPAAGPWSAAQPVSPSGDIALEPQVAMNPTGLAVAIWLHKRAAPVVTVETTSKLGAAAWGAIPKVLSAPVTSTTPIAGWEPQVRINANARFAVWAQQATPERSVLESAWGSGCNTCNWGEDAASHQASDGATSVEAPQVAIDGQGRAVAVWRNLPAASSVGGVQASTTAFINGPWSSPVTLSTVGLFVFAEPPQIASDLAGNTTVVWPAMDNKIHAVSRPAGGAFGSEAPISGNAEQDPKVAMDPGGDAFATWTSTGGGERRIVVALRDETPPLLSGLNVPVLGKAGTAVAMSAIATDVWSPPATVTWDFGDGTTATGAAVSHAYASGGTKTVSVSATDVVGSTSASQTRQITVTQAPSEKPRSRRVALGVSVPKQSWKTIAKAKAVKLRCSLDAVGACSAKATVARSTAKQLGLKLPAGTKPLQVGVGTVSITHSGRLTDLVVKLKSGKVRAAIAAAIHSVPLKLTITGSARGYLSATRTRTLTIQRP